ncbi:hypothetical protein GCM10011409_09400 [Lentibacillus populi]|uniref:Alpha/beta hydrolase n=1 Tax=Lentibacillus populi TaxID=1827502 RepID=A0A9W5TVI5_9BACI|nr:MULTISPECIES: alpha/beta hydrolase [Bacillaceae]GGB34087.1 hypothetical protein GCM10011409_09400 [Lentibacillus populi]
MNFFLKQPSNKMTKGLKKKFRQLPFYFENRGYNRIRGKYLNKYGGGMTHKQYSNIRTMAQTLSCGSYKLQERINILLGSTYSYLSLAREMATSDLVELAPKFEIPVYIIHGIHDYQTTHTQAKRYFEAIEAPMKKMYTFSHSAHSPYIEEQERFYEIIEKDILRC